MEYQEVIIEIGRRIKEIRQNNNLTQLDLSSKCGIEQTNIARIELGKTSPSLRTLLKIAEALEIDVKELL